MPRARDPDDLSELVGAALDASNWVERVAGGLAGDPLASGDSLSEAVAARDRSFQALAIAVVRAVRDGKTLELRGGPIPAEAAPIPAPNVHAALIHEDPARLDVVPPPQPPPPPIAVPIDDMDPTADRASAWQPPPSVPVGVTPAPNPLTPRPVPPHLPPASPVPPADRAARGLSPMIPPGHDPLTPIHGIRRVMERINEPQPKVPTPLPLKKAWRRAEPAAPPVTPTGPMPSNVRSAVFAGLVGEAPQPEPGSDLDAEPLQGPSRRTRRRMHAAKQEARRERDGAVPSEGPSTLELWPWLALTEGKRAVLVGGDGRQESRERLLHDFGFSSLDWETGWEPDRTNTLIRSIQVGEVDLVLFVTRYMKHLASDLVIPACRDAGVQFVPIRGGYGRTAIQTAIEEAYPDYEGAI